MNLYEVGNNSIVYNQTVILYFFNTSIVISGETSYKVQCVKDNNQTASHLNGAIQVTINEDNIVKCKFWFILWNCFLRLFENSISILQLYKISDLPINLYICLVALRIAIYEILVAESFFLYVQKYRRKSEEK